MKTDVAAAIFPQKLRTTPCRSCGHVGLEPVLDLGVTALVDTLVPADRLGAPENKHPLQVGFCSNCALMQVCDTVPPDEVFHPEYSYFASFSTTWLKHSRACVLKQIDRDLMLYHRHLQRHRSSAWALVAAATRVVPLVYELILPAGRREECHSC